MDALAIFCKSYRGDVDRCADLVASLRRHNRAGLPVYLCVPAADRPLFADRVGQNGVRYLTDEELVGGPIAQSWHNQQIVKLRFAGAGLAATYFWIDSDFVVIRDFDERDLLAYPDVPFTVVEEARPDLFRERMLGGAGAARDPEYARMLTELHASLAIVRDTFGRRGPVYYFGSPAIWSCRVVHALEAWLRERRLTFQSMLARSPYELAWYGEFLLAHPVIRVVPRGALSFPFTRDDEYDRFAAAGLTIADLAAQGYLVINFASKWMRNAAPEALRGLQASVPGPGAEVARRPGRIDLTSQWRGSYHRSGWGYALDALRPLHHPGGVQIEGFIEKKFGWGTDPGDRENDFRPLDRPWIGFLHNPPAIPAWFNIRRQDPRDILDSDGWRASLPHCRGLFTLSEALARWLRPRVPVPVCSLKHPSAPTAIVFSMDAYQRNASRSVVQVGWWLRRFASLHELPVRRLHKVLLDLRQPWMRSIIDHEMALMSPERRCGAVTPVAYLDAGDYDRFLSRNIVFLDLYDASANNAVIECILRRTPLLVNRLDAVVEYLGADYPLYFDTLDEAAAKADDDDAVAAAHAHLARLASGDELTQEAFYRGFLASPICRELGIEA